MKPKKPLLLIGLVLVVLGIATFPAAHTVGVVLLVLAIVALIVSVGSRQGLQD